MTLTYRFRHQTFDHPLYPYIVEAMDKEFDSLTEQEAWSKPMTAPEGVKPLDVLWVYAAKPDINGWVKQIKARLTIRGDQDKHSVSKFDAYAPVMCFTIVRILLSLHLGEEGVEFHQLDIKTAFLTAEVKREIFIRLPPDRRTKKDEVRKLLKNMYGGVDASRCFYDDYMKFHEEIGFQSIHHDKCYLHLYWLDSDPVQFIKLAFHVDDSVICSKGQDIMHWYLWTMNERYDFTFHPLSHFIGIRFTFSEDRQTVHLDQEQQVNKMLAQFNMSNCKPEKTPVGAVEPTKAHLPENAKERKECNKFPYREAIGHLQYLELGSRADITYPVKLASKFGNSHGRVQIDYVKHIMRYLKGTSKTGITIRKNRDRQLRIFSDANHVKDVDTRRSLSGMIAKIGINTIEWKSKYQRIPSHSTAESELMAIDAAICRGQYLRYLTQSLGGPKQNSVPMYVDCQPAINLAVNPIQPGRNVHVHARYFYVRQLVMEGLYHINYLSSTNQPADLLVTYKNDKQFREHVSRVLSTAYISIKNEDSIYEWQ